MRTGKLGIVWSDAVAMQIEILEFLIFPKIRATLKGQN